MLCYATQEGIKQINNSILSNHFAPPPPTTNKQTNNAPTSHKAKRINIGFGELAQIVLQTISANSTRLASLSRIYYNLIREIIDS